jgi:hypothetical protein
MAVLKSISGHTDLRKCRDYLYLGKGDVRDYFLGKGGDRCIAKDFVNIPDGYGAENWDLFMDQSRRDAEAGKTRGRKSTTTYRHFIISPNPKDDCDLATLRSLATRWCEDLFGGQGARFGMFPCAIFYHDDNSERVERGLPGIPHAHVIVGNTSLTDNRRLHFGYKDWGHLAKHLEALSKELGLSYFSVDRVENDDGSVVYERKLNAPVKDKKGSKVRKEATGEYEYAARPSEQAEYRTKAERDAKERGVPIWKDEIRESIDIACSLSDDMGEFRRNLAKMGIVTTERKGRVNKGVDLIYYYPQPGVEPDKNKKRVGGARLGTGYTNAAIEGKIRLAYYRRLYPPDRDEERIIDLVSDINVVRTRPGADISLSDLSRAFAAINGAKLQTMEEAKERLAHHRMLVAAHPEDPRYAGNREQIKNIEALLRVAKVTSILPMNTYHAATPPKDIKRQRDMAAAGGRKVALMEKVRRGWPLTRDEERELKKRPSTYNRWRRNYELASQGMDDRIGTGGGSAEGAGESRRSRPESSGGRSRTR